MSKRQREGERERQQASVRARESQRASKRERKRENARARERVREKASVLPTYQAPHSPAPRSISAGRERCAARSCPHDFFQVRPVIACIACMRPHTHTHTHTHCKQSKRQVSSPRRPHAAPPSTVLHCRVSVGERRGARCCGEGGVRVGRSRCAWRGGGLRPSSRRRARVLAGVSRGLECSACDGLTSVRPCAGGLFSPPAACIDG